MIILKITVICPCCEESIILDMEDIKIEYAFKDLLISFECPYCKEQVDQEAIELKY